MEEESPSSPKHFGRMKGRYQLKVQAAAGAADALTKTSAAAELEATLASREEELREFRGERRPYSSKGCWHSKLT